jgi:hypothetical protein
LENVQPISLAKGIAPEQVCAAQKKLGLYPGRGNGSGHPRLSGFFADPRRGQSINNAILSLKQNSESDNGHVAF